LRVKSIEAVDGRYWHVLEEPVEIAGPVEAAVDPEFRSMMAQLHTDTHVPEAQALAEHGLIRNRSVAPPPAPDGTVRIVEIVGLDRQACGGTHLPSTGASRPIRIFKIDNKGRHNRRIRIGLTDPPRVTAGPDACFRDD